MALFTPRGLKVVLPTAYAFALMARVYPKTDAFRVLQLTEEVENLPKLAALIAGFVAFALQLTSAHIAVTVFLSVSVFRLAHLLGLLVPPLTFLLPVSRVYSFITGYGVLLAALLSVGFLAVGWKGVLAFAVGRLFATALFGLLDLGYMSFAHTKTGVAVTASERSFFHAYRLAASRLGVSTDLAVSETELARPNWAAVYEDLALKWPGVVRRFTGDQA